MDRAKPSQKENKLLLLYAAEQIGAMTQQQINRLMIENDLMDYIDLQLSLAELLEAELLQTISADDVRYLSLTSKGRETLSFFINQIPHSRVASIDEIAAQWREIFATESQTTASYTKTKQGDYLVRLGAREGGVNLMRVSLNVPGRAQAVALCANWRSRAGEAYKALMETLLRTNSQQ